MASRRLSRLVAVSFVSLVAGLGAWLSTSGPAAAEGVALTFDDVPGLSLTDDAGYWARTNAELIRSLRARRLPAVGFVIRDGVGPGPDLETEHLF